MNMSMTRSRPTVVQKLLDMGLVSNKRELRKKRKKGEKSSKRRKTPREDMDEEAEEGDESDNSERSREEGYDNVVLYYDQYYYYLFLIFLFVAHMFVQSTMYNYHKIYLLSNNGEIGDDIVIC